MTGKSALTEFRKQVVGAITAYTSDPAIRSILFKAVKDSYDNIYKAHTHHIEKQKEKEKELRSKHESDDTDIDF